MGKRALICGAAAAAVLLALSETAPAQVSSQAGSVLIAQGPPSNASPDRIMRRMDADDDGRISREEFRGRPQQFPMMDADGDGFLTREEIGAFMARLRSGGGPGHTGGPDRGADNALAVWYRTLPIILTHTHLNVQVERKRDGEEDWNGAETNALSLMDRLGIRAAVIMAPPRPSGVPALEDYFPGLLQVARRHPGRFIVSGGGGALNPVINSTPPNEVDDDVRRVFAARAEEIIAAGAKGFGETTALHFSFFKGHPFEQMQPDHPLFLLLADLAAKHDVPLDLHMEAVAHDKPVSADLRRQSDANPDQVQANISALERLLAHNRRARIIWVHLGMDYTGDRSVALTRRLLREHPNLFLSITGFQNAPGDNWFILPQRGLNPDWRELIIEFPDRFVIGSDAFFQGDRVWHKFPQPLTAATAVVRRPFLPPAVARKVAFENAQRLFRLTLIRPEDHPLPAGAGAAEPTAAPPVSFGGRAGGPADASAVEPVGPRGLTARQVISKDDGDGDGRLSRAEFRGPPFLFNRTDRNKDGFITREELETRWRAHSMH